jgi:hypothetical protein
MGHSSIDVGEKPIPAAKVQELSRIVNTEFVQRGVINFQKPRRS